MKRFSNSGLRRFCGSAVVFFIFGFSALGAQDFWFDDAGSDVGGGASDIASSGRPGLRASGDLSAELLVFPHELRDKGGATDWGNLVSATLNIGASGPGAEAVLNFNLSPSTLKSSASSDLSQTPPVIDELYLRVFLGSLTLETGLRKLAWGRADIQGPLDVTNPLDYTDLTRVGDTMGRKIARPMIHASLPLGSASTLEGVFIPSFQGHRYSLDPEDHWYPTAITSGRRDRIIDDLIKELGQFLPPALLPATESAIKGKAAGISLTQSSIPDTSGLEYAQGGLRFTTTLGPADIGAQYYSGHLFRPAFTLTGVDELLVVAATTPAAISLVLPNLEPEPRISYNRYHQLGFDYTQVIFDLSFRAELAAHITEDLSGDDGNLYNPFLAWSAGFDRDIFGFTFFIEIDESIRLLNDKVGSNAALDTEAGSPLTTTALTTQLSRAFFQDRLEAKFGLLWNVEAGDVYLMPSLSYRVDDVEAVLAGGIFAGKDGGELSQYRNKAYIKAAISYSF
ncbi:MAG: hypothetical protein LBD96_07905 [Treponema sp.]|jgi:hypothetical protein|nr:hypothetical protein [Treponema sp.]